jgi:hypothetical protein
MADLLTPEVQPTDLTRPVTEEEKKQWREEMLRNSNLFRMLPMQAFLIDRPQEPKTYGDFLQQRQKWGNPRLSDLANAGLGAAGWGPSPLSMGAGAALGVLGGRAADTPEVATNAATALEARGIGALASKIPAPGMLGTVAKAAGIGGSLYAANKGNVAAANAVREEAAKRAGSPEAAGVQPPRETGMLESASMLIPGFAPIYEKLARSNPKYAATELVNKTFKKLGINLDANFFGSAPHVTGAEGIPGELADVSKVPGTTVGMNLAKAQNTARQAKITSDVSRGSMTAQTKVMREADKKLVEVTEAASKEAKAAQTYEHGLGVADLKYAYETRLDGIRNQMADVMTKAPGAEAGAATISNVSQPAAAKIAELDKNLAYIDTQLKKHSMGAIDLGGGEYGKLDMNEVNELLTSRGRLSQQRITVLAQDKAAQLGLKGDALSQLAAREPEMARLQAELRAMQREQAWQLNRIKAGKGAFNPNLDTDAVRAARAQFNKEADAFETIHQAFNDDKLKLIQARRDASDAQELFELSRRSPGEPMTEMHNTLSQAAGVGPETFADALHRNQLAGEKGLGIDLGDAAQDLYKTWEAKGAKDAPEKYKRLFARDFFNAVQTHSQSQQFLDSGSKGAPLMAIKTRLGKDPEATLAKIFATPGVPMEKAAGQAKDWLSMVDKLNQMSLPIAQRGRGFLGLIQDWLFFDMARGLGGTSVGIGATMLYTVVKKVNALEFIEKSLDNPKLYNEFIEKVSKDGVRGLNAAPKRLRDVWNSLGGNVSVATGNLAAAFHNIKSSAQSAFTKADKEMDKPGEDRHSPAPSREQYDFSPTAPWRTKKP